MLTLHARPQVAFLARLFALLLLAAAVVAIALAAAPGAQAAAAASATNCAVKGKEQKLGPTYVTKVTAKGTTCPSALKLVTAFYKCRTAKNGPAGRCTKKVSGYACRETRTSSPTQFDAKVTCTSGKKVVAHNYPQNT
ncbi:MAG: hypothetical protein Q7T55_15270 [Solirubrobacteraceae bacterium]|nr:hypothetical protein [Solirubrobacteraceae bacterium]